jgi:hypothetical protein
MKDCIKMFDPNSEAFNNLSIGNSTFSWYSPLCFESLMVYIQPIVEREVGKKLLPTYSYGRIYWNGSELKKHTDRNSSEVTASCCLKKDIDWSLNYEYEEKIISSNLNVGDISICHGSKIPHWREKYEGTEHIQAFVQYVYEDGEYSNLKYDTRPCLAAPYETTSDQIKREFKDQYKYK